MTIHISSEVDQVSRRVFLILILDHRADEIDEISLSDSSEFELDTSMEDDSILLYLDISIVSVSLRN